MTNKPGWKMPALAVVVLAMGLGIGAFGLGLLDGLGFWALIIGVVVSCIVGYALSEAKRLEGDRPCLGCGRAAGQASRPDVPVRMTLLARRAPH